MGLLCHFHGVNFMICFLDFDGVLHPSDALPSDVFTRVFRFERLLRDYPEVRIVISSDWRLGATLDELRENFSMDMRTRIIGMTPFIADHDVTVGHRQLEIESWLVMNNQQNAPWIALDDIEQNFLPGAPLILCETPFGEAQEIALLRWIKSQLNLQEESLMPRI